MFDETHGPIVDAHAHLRLQEGATEKLVQELNACGIERAIVIAGGTISPELLSRHYCEGGSADVDVDNAAVLAECRKTGGKLTPFYFANSLKGAEGYLREGKDFAGLKIAPIVHGVPFHDPRIHELIAASVRFKHPVYLHCLPRAGFGVADLVGLAQAHPDARIIMGHGGVGHGDFHGIDLIKPQANLYFEVSGSFFLATKLAWQKLGADRVIFGSEYPLQHHRVELAKMECLDLPERDFHLIMRENILRLLGESA